MAPALPDLGDRPRRAGHGTERHVPVRRCGLRRGQGRPSDAAGRQRLHRPAQVLGRGADAAVPSILQRERQRGRRGLPHPERLRRQQPLASAEARDGRHADGGPAGGEAAARHSGERVRDARGCNAPALRGEARRCGPRPPPRGGARGPQHQEQAGPDAAGRCQDLLRRQRAEAVGGLLDAGKRAADHASGRVAQAAERRRGARHRQGRQGSASEGGRCLRGGRLWRGAGPRR
mmetsp:Transcript_128021/g.398653  ORF Transcript_128021/g.398653 Transcript_128021/m.398653 type:complete len:233 (+) Transcript_128021:441-1139(+)